MLLLLLILVVNCVNCENDGKIPVKFDESQLIAQHHQHFRQVSEFLKDVQHKIHEERSVLRAFEHQPTGDNEFLDYSITNLWWNGTANPHTTFLPTPAGYGKTTAETIVARTYLPYPPLFPPSFGPIEDGGPEHQPPYPYPVHPPKETSLPSKPKPHVPLYQQFRLPSPSSVLPKTPNGYKSPSSPHRPKVTRPEALHHQKHPSSTRRPVIFQRGIDRTQSPTSSKQTATQVSKPPTSASPNTKYIKIWLYEMTNYTPVDKRLHSLTMKVMTPSYYTSKRSQIKYTTSTRKVRPRVRNRHLKTSSRPSPAVHRQGISLPNTPTQPEDYGFSIATGQEQFFLDDQLGFVQLGTAPDEGEHTRTTMAEGRPVYKPYEPTTASTAGDMLHRAMVAPSPRVASPYKHYDDMMEQLNEGYMMVFLLELTSLVASKDPKHVYDVIRHAKIITNESFEKARLAWFGQPLAEVTISLGRFLAEGEIAIVRSYASMMHHLLQTRRTALATDVNSIIDYADLLYEYQEGYMLFDSLIEFQLYPNTTKTSREVCDGLIENFLRPFRRLYHSERRQALLDSVNYALKIRFPRFTNLRRSNEDTSEEEQDNKSARSIKHIIKKTRHHAAHRGRQTRNRHTTTNRGVEYSNESLYRRHYTPTEVFPKMRSMKPITELQKRYSIIAPKHRFRGMNTQTEAKYQNIKTRRTTDYHSGAPTHTSTPTQFFHDTGTVGSDDEGHSESADDRRDESGRHRGTAKTEQKSAKSIYLQMKQRSIEESQNKAVSVKLKAEMLRRIVEGSSYSDEEESLKMNLIQALLHGNRSFVLDDVETKTTTVTASVDTVEETMRGIESMEIVRPSDESDMTPEDRDGAMQNGL